MDPRLPEFVQIQILVAEILAIAAGLLEKIHWLIVVKATKIFKRHAIQIHWKTC